ncbi:conserved hypothetical protein [Methanocaldococcus sp. FS406-22]|uniref:PIN domain-containing protein n=1 Tax=Methanocaldococcus sp. (strain FS406-22) TaxID=644281 RepID=UPI0001BF3503|nr:PIN domain-containing protein [Methanocaldococcus sp. FS406-22]ADC69805.1 conserved hypothetical protein [Methanocaldococcus sp. FS406-22]
MIISPNALSSHNTLNCSVDTNILIAIYNEEDRLHQDALKLINHVNNNLYIGFAVLDETVITFGRKIREIMGKIISFYSKLNLKIPKEKIIDEEEKLLSQLNSENPRNENFHKFIIKKAREIRGKCSSNMEIIRELLRLHKELNDANHILCVITNRILKINNNINFCLYTFEYINSYKEKIKEILDVIDDIKFKDDNDKKYL